MLGITASQVARIEKRTVTDMLYELVQKNAGRLGPQAACHAVDVSRSGYWTWQHAPPTKPEPFLGQIRAIVSEFNGYGYRRVTAELRRRNFVVNHKKVQQFMRENGLSCKRKRFRIVTTDSKHGLPVYPNLAKSLALTGLNQLWVSDITYVQLLQGFVYLAVVLDAYSRKCLGWQLSRSIDARLCLDALEMAFDSRKAMSLAGLIHHSDQGVQYASGDYVDALHARGVQISMSRKGNPYDNAKAESFMKTFKVEEVYVSEYESFQDALENIQRFLEVVYNKKRLHSSIGYLPPAEYEAQLLTRCALN